MVYSLAYNVITELSGYGYSVCDTINGIRYFNTTVYHLYLINPITSTWWTLAIMLFVCISHQRHVEGVTQVQWHLPCPDMLPIVPLTIIRATLRFNKVFNNVHLNKVMQPPIPSSLMIQQQNVGDERIIINDCRMVTSGAGRYSKLQNQSKNHRGDLRIILDEMKFIVIEVTNRRDLRVIVFMFFIS